MPDSQTANYGLTKIGVGESKDTWGGKLNVNFDTIDTAIKAVSDALAAGITPAALLAAMLTVDGEGSGLDADKLEGHDAAYFAQATQVTAAAILAALLTVDGAGSTLDADTVDGKQAADFFLAAGGTVEGEILRDTAGAVIFHTADGMDHGGLFLTPDGDPDPTSQPGHIWATYTP